MRRHALLMIDTFLFLTSVLGSVPPLSLTLESAKFHAAIYKATTTPDDALAGALDLLEQSSPTWSQWFPYGG